VIIRIELHPARLYTYVRLIIREPYFEDEDGVLDLNLRFFFDDPGSAKFLE